jgi:nucleoside-diphosphate-sugar epimerase
VNARSFKQYQRGIWRSSVHPQTESYWGNVSPIGIRSCYDEETLRGNLVYGLHNQNKVAIKIIRIFNTYGPNMNPSDGRVVSNFIVQALKGKISLSLEMDCKHVLFNTLMIW